MDFAEFNQRRENLNQILKDSDSFFTEFGLLDDSVYAQGAIPKKYKELTGLSLSIFSKCEECIAYHVQNCKEQNCSKNEVAEAVKLAVAAGGSVTYPWARKAIELMELLEFDLHSKQEKEKLPVSE
ncbi:MAG: carboxymuconolactone decarboxylase family protein [Desulfobacteraceae bacterium]|nr:carboxymuconolactone decarboxylase family protein [Desulfobacteraceae bacterium]